jgi:hypothetical protein
MRSVLLRCLLCAGLLHAQQLRACPDPERTLADACPELLAQMQSQSQDLSDALGVNSEKMADALLVQQLQRFVDEQLLRSAAPAAINEQELREVLAQHYVRAEPQESSMFESIARWWRSLFGDDDAGSGNELAGFFEKLKPSETFARLLFYLLLGLMLAFFAVHGWREIEPLLHAHRSARKQQALERARLLAWPPNLDGLNARASLARVYARLLSIFGQRGVLDRQQALTHAEAAVAVQQHAALSPEQRARFAMLTQQASDSLFAEQTPDAESVRQALDEATTLLQASAALPAQLKMSAHTPAVSGSPHA